MCFVLLLYIVDFMYFVLNRSKDDHNKSVKKHITEEIILKQENTYTQVEIQSTVF